MKFFVSFGDTWFHNAFGLFFHKLYFSAEHAEMTADTKFGRDGAFPVQMHDSVHELDKIFILHSLNHACTPAKILDRVVRVSDERDNFVIIVCVVLLDLFDVVKNCVNKGLVVRGLFWWLFGMSFEVCWFVEISVSFVDEDVKILFGEDVNFGDGFGVIELVETAFVFFMALFDVF